MVGDYFNRAHVTPRNDPSLSLPVQVRVKRPFCVKGKRIEEGEVVTVEAHVARDVVALGKAEYCR